MFLKGSRYEDVDDEELEDSTERTIRYKKIRFTPETKSRRTYTVCQNDRLDLIAQHQLQDPELFWRICDANPVLWPDDLTAEPGQSIRIPPAEG